MIARGRASSRREGRGVTSGHGTDPRPPIASAHVRTGARRDGARGRRPPRHGGGVRRSGPAVAHVHRAAGRGGAGRPRAHPSRGGACRARVAAAPGGGEPRAGQPPEGGAGARSADRGRRCWSRPAQVPGRAARRVGVRGRAVAQGRAPADARACCRWRSRRPRRGSRASWCPRRTPLEAAQVDGLRGRGRAIAAGGRRRSCGDAGRRPRRRRAAGRPTSVDGVDLSEVRGQAQARRALEVAAAGGHNLLMVGSPGRGQDDARAAAAHDPARA